MKVGLLSDTHGYLDNKIYNYFSDVDEIWHAGDIGSIEVADKLSEFKTFRAVYGNIDNHIVRSAYPEILDFTTGKARILIKHIGGYPNKYDPSIKRTIENNPPDLFVSGHSHILKVMYDKKLNVLHINPGAAGKTGLHKVRTLVRFSIEGKSFTDLEVIELHNI
jgi:putative phosphoesterase